MLNQFAIAAPAAQPAGVAQPPVKSVAPAAVAGFRRHPFVQLLRPGDSIAATGMASPAVPEMSVRAFVAAKAPPPNYQGIWDDRFGFIDDEAFALLDVSSNANQMGVSLASLGERQLAMVRTHEAIPAAQVEALTDNFPLQVRGMDVVAKSQFVRAFTTPILSCGSR